MNKINQILDKKRNLYAIAAFAILMESLTTTFMKIGGKYPLFSLPYLTFFGIAVAIMAVYAVIWQLILERMPLTTAYLRKGISYVLVFFWAIVIFHETITLRQFIGVIVIIIGMVVSMTDEH